jgi:hypothetical protein
MTKSGWDAHGPKGNRDPKKRGLDKTIKNMKKDNKKGGICGLLTFIPLLALLGIVVWLIAS